MMMRSGMKRRRILRSTRFNWKFFQATGGPVSVLSIWLRYVFRIPSFVMSKKPNLFKKGIRTLNRTICSVEASQLQKDSIWTIVWGEKMLGVNLKTEFEIPTVKKNDKTHNWEAVRAGLILLACSGLKGAMGWFSCISCISLGLLLFIWKDYNSEPQFVF